MADRTIKLERAKRRDGTIGVEPPADIDLTPIDRLGRDHLAAALTLSDDEARFLVDAYYTMQKNRIRSNNQVRALDDSGEPNAVLTWLATQDQRLEDQIKAALDYYSRVNPLGAWARSIVGIGPVLAAGLLAHIDLERAPTVGRIWRFAGLDSKVEWLGKVRSAELFNDVVGKRGKANPEQIAAIAGRANLNPVLLVERMSALSRADQTALLAKRPWNTNLKTLCYKIGESFVKTSNLEDGFYGKLYAQRKAIEIARNEQGKNAEAAAGILAAKNFGKTTDAYAAYSVGRLPPAHIHARARRWAVKLFLSHYHEMGYRLVLRKEPPKPFAISVLGHADYIPPPNRERFLPATG